MNLTSWFDTDQDSDVEVLCEDGDRLFCRGMRHSSQGNQSSLLAVLSATAHPTRSNRLTHEYGLREHLDGAWAVRPLELVRERGRTILVLEDRGGEPLERLLGRPMETRTFLRIGVALTAALGRLHERGLVHKDVKPANVFVNSADEVRLTGFGITSRLPRERQAPEPPEIIGGTLAYMAPEQTGRMNRSVDARSDLYSLGVTLYQMLTGLLPFAAADPMELVHCHIARQPVPPAERMPGVPLAISAVVMKLLSKTPEDRYQTAAGVAADLRRCLTLYQFAGSIEPFALAAHDIPDVLRIPEKLYGRDREVRALLGAFERVVSGGEPELLLVSGYSGIGKSSVVAELHKAIVPPRGLFASGKFEQYRRNIPYATLAQAFQTLVRQLLGRSEAEIARWRDALREALGSNGALMVSIIPELELIIGKQPPVPELPPQEAQGRFQRVFRRLIGVFARPEHPLVLFLDDLQWLDAATLTLLADLATQSEVRDLLLVGAYRDNEVGPSHPLVRTLEAIRNAGAAVNEIVLAPLALEDVGALIADSLHCDAARAQPLAELVYEKTAGNPFFAIQFLGALAEEKLLSYDASAGCWNADLQRIRAKSHTDNVVDLMIGKLTRLPEETQDALKLLACLGSVAGFETLGLACDRPADAVHDSLWHAVRDGLVLRQEGSYAFLHDRVQEAAYSLIPEQQRPAVHLRIGRTLLGRMLPDEVIYVANQLNLGAALIVETEERERVADLNLRAGRKAKASTAYSSACTYLGAGMSLLDGEAWTRRYDLAFGLWLERAECEYLSGNFDRAETLISELLLRGASKIDKAAAYRLKIDLHVMKSEYPKAVESALACLALLGIEMTAHPTREQVEIEYEKVWRNLGNRPIDSLVDLAPMTNPEMQAAMRVLSVLFAPAYFTDRNLLHLHMCHMVNLTLEHGTSDAAAHGYACFGVTIGPNFRRYVDGYRFCKLACDLVERLDLVAFKAKVYFSAEMAVLWTQPVTTALSYIEAAHRAAVEGGDPTIACYSCNHTVTDMFLRGDHLDDVWRETERGLEFARKAKFRDVVDVIVAQQRFIENMRGRTESFSTFSGAAFDEAAFEAELLTEERMATMVCWYWIMKLQARFLSGDYGAALDASRKANALLWSSDGHIQLLDYHFYTGLTLAAAWDSSRPDGHREAHEAITAQLEQLSEWAENGAVTFRDRHALLSAEVARIEGRVLEAERLYEESIRLSREHRFIQNEALGSELAGRFYLDRGLETNGYAHLRNARACYALWGAEGKVRDLDSRYPAVATIAGRPRAETIDAAIQKLDVTTVLKASQAVSGEIELPKLIERLMTIALENAGADRGLLILPRKEGYVVEAVAELNHGEIALCPTPAGGPSAPDSLVRYVIRTQKSVILDDARKPNPFSGDDYLVQRKPHAVFCLPLVRQTALAGVLYLENTLTSHVFTPERTALLGLLASQLAVSLENTRLYEDLREREAKIRRLVESNIIGIIIFNLSGEIVEANDAFLRLVGYSHEEVAAGRVRWTDLTPQEWGPGDERAVAELKSRGTVPAREKEYLRKDGGRVPVLVGAAAFGDRRDQGVAFVVDLTERKRAEQEALESERRYQEMQMELAHANRVATMGQLSASIAHEINQPVAGVVINAHTGLRWLAAESPNVEGVREVLGRIIRDANRAAEVISRTRNLIKKAPPRKDPLDINEAIQEVIALTRAEAIKRGVSVRVQVAEDLPILLADRVQLQQVVLNLIMNAMEAMQQASEGPRELLISAGTAPAGGVLIAVRDSGPGVDPADFERIFGAFYSTKPAGLGVGLSISRTIIEAQGGRLWVTSGSPRGTVFQFSLPGGTEG